MQQPKISIIIPVYNAEKTLNRCLDTLVSQTYKNIEILCIDDCSSDNSFNILKEYEKKDSRIIAIKRVKNQGQGPVRNYALSIAKGDYIMFADADDWYENNACEILYNNIKNNCNVDIIFFDYNRIINNIKISEKKYYYIDKCYKNKIIHISEIFEIIVKFSRESWYKIYKKDFIISNNIKFSDTRGSEDTPFWIKVLISNPACIIIDDILYNYVINEFSSSGTKSSSKYYRDIFRSFKISNDIIINSDIDKKLRFLLLESNFRWYNYRHNNYILDIQNKSQKLLKKLYTEYAKKFKHNEDLKFLLPLCNSYYTNRLQQIFSIRNENNHKVLTILGLKIKFKKKPKNVKIGQVKDIIINKENIETIDIIKEDAVTICFSSNNDFFEYLYICIFSLIKNANKNKFYDIVVLEKDITDLNKAQLKSLENNNISIRFYNINTCINYLNIDFTINFHFALENYFRLFIPCIFENYKKVLYMDCDGIFQDDVSKIYSTDIGEYWLGAVKDYAVFNEIFTYQNIDYYFQQLQLKNIFNYVNSGVMIMNIPKLLENNFTKNTLELANKFTPLYVDQCIINKIAEDKIKFLDTKNNVNYVYEYLLTKSCRKDCLPIDFKQEFLRGREEPIFIHYLTHLKPWKNPDVPKSDIFWQYAKESGMYERVLYKNIGNK